MAELTYQDPTTLGILDMLHEQAAIPRNLATLLSASRVEGYRCDYDAEAGLSYNYAAKLVDDALLDELSKAAETAQLIDKYRALLEGAVMNTGERRRVLHHLTRGQVLGPVVEEDRDLGAFYREQIDRAFTFAEDVHEGRITAPGGDRFTDVVQIGIGGSDLGPRALHIALRHLIQTNPAEYPDGVRLRGSFISNVDPDDALSVLRTIDGTRALFIVVSKSGTTQETLTNRDLVTDYLRSVVDGFDPQKQMVAVTSQTSPMAQGGDYLERFYIDDYIGGRYSSTSAVGATILALSFGPDVVRQLLDGAHHADIGALNPNLRENPAMLDALIGVWERNGLGYPVTAILPYSQALARFPAHLQQLDMESNGKRVNRTGQPVTYPTGPIVFGEPGTNGQHSFYQLLHQGTDVVPLQFVGFRHEQSGPTAARTGESTTKLNANLAAQIVAFAAGHRSTEGAKDFPGGRPSSLLVGDRLTPRVLGALLAHYENKVMYQGFLWNINSFDQEGVQLGKVLTSRLLSGDGDDPLLLAYAGLLTGSGPRGSV